MKKKTFLKKCGKREVSEEATTPEDWITYTDSLKFKAL